MFIIVSLKAIIGSEISKITPGQNSSFKSLIHLSKWISPQVDKINSPFAFVKTDTLGSDLFNFYNPSLSRSISPKSFGITETLIIP